MSNAGGFVNREGAAIQTQRGFTGNFGGQYFERMLAGGWNRGRKRELRTSRFVRGGLAVSELAMARPGPAIPRAVWGSLKSFFRNLDAVA